MSGLGNTATILTAVGSAGLLSFVLEVYRTFRASKRERADLEARASSAPIANESLLLGNAEQALGIQKGVIDRLNGHIGWQDRQIADLHQQLSMRDSRLAELEATAQSLRRQVDSLESQIARMRAETDPPDIVKGPSR